MITSEQQTWLDHLSDTETVKVIAYDQTAEKKFQQIKKIIQNLLGSQQSVIHCGASFFKISGQDEIDVYVPVPAKDFNASAGKLATLFGEPRSNYPFKRARFVTSVDKKHIDVFVINNEDKGWLDLLIFQAYLTTHPQELENYELLKEQAAGQSTREYYRQKIEYINAIIAKAIN